MKRIGFAKASALTCALSLFVVLGRPTDVRAAEGAVEAPPAGGGSDQAGVSTCRRLPKQARLVKLNLKPDTEVVDLVAWIASITCRQFVLPGTVTASGKQVTVHAPQLMSAEEAYALFLSALDSVGLTVQPSGRFYRIIETRSAKSSPLPLYGFKGERLFDEDSGELEVESIPAPPPPALRKPPVRRDVRPPPRTSSSGDVS